MEKTVTIHRTKMPMIEYINGNYRVKIYRDGTKKRISTEESPKPVFPETIDLKITNNCDLDCPMCHENSHFKGKHGNINLKFLQSLKPGMEVAVGGGNPLSHPIFDTLCEMLHEKQCIMNLTIHQNHLMKNMTKIHRLIRESKIYGIGISITKLNKELIDFCEQHSSAVIHVIAGIITYEELLALAKYHMKVIILGYKNVGRGKQFYSNTVEKNITDLKKHLANSLRSFNVLSFDQLALEQLEVQKHVPKHVWNKYYLGEEGQFSMYIDLVEEKFAVSSSTKQRFKIMDSIEEMFNRVQTSI